MKTVIVHLWGTRKFAYLYKPRPNEKIIKILLDNFTYSPTDLNLQIFEPAALNCVKAVIHLIRIPCFRDNIFLATWDTIIKKTFKSLNLLVSDINTTSKNENLIVEMFILLYEFLNPQYSSDCILLSNCKTMYEKYHLKLFYIVLNYFRNVFTDNKRERESLIFIFKIINKSIIDLSCTEIKLCYRFFKLGVQFILEVKAITSIRLVNELSIFFNLVAPFISVKTLHKLTGDNWNIDSYGEIVNTTANNPITSSRSEVFEISDVVSGIINPSSDVDDSSVISTGEDELGDDDDGPSYFNDSSTSNSYKKRKLDTEKNTSLGELNDLAKIIEIAFNLLNDTSMENQLSIENDSINIHMFPITDTSKLNLFIMRYISLSKGQNPTPWLLRLGIVKLLIGFYELKHDSLETVSSSELTIVNKRQKNAEMRLGMSFQFSDYIQVFDDPLDCILSLLTEDPFQNVSYNVASSQLLILFFGYVSSTSINVKIEKLLVESLINKEEIMKDLVTLFERYDTNQKFWILVSINVFYSTITTFTNDKQKMIKEKLFSISFNKLLKYCLECLKEPILCKLSCVFLSHFSIYHFSSNAISASLEKNIIQQYENIINLSEINGPALLCSESIFFWISTVNICKNFKFNNIKFHNSLNTYDSQLFSQKVFNWLNGKLDLIIEKCGMFDIFMIVNFIRWVSGLDSIEILPEVSHNMELFYKGSSFDFGEKMIKQRDLLDYILKNKVVRPILFIKESINNLKVEKLTTNDTTKIRLRTSFTKILESLYFNNNHDSLIDWCFSSLIFINDHGYSELVGKLTDNINERFRNFRNDKGFQSFLGKYFDTFCKLPMEWVNKVKEITSITELMERALYEINSLTFLEVGGESTEYDIFDSFMPSTSTALSEDAFPNYAIYNYSFLKHERTLEQKATMTCLKYGSSCDESLKNTLSFVSKINSKFKCIAAQIVIYKFIPQNAISSIQESNIDTLFNLLTSLLEDYLTKTNECALVIVGQTFRLFCHQWMNCQSHGIDSDGKAVYEYFCLLYNRDMICTQEVYLEFCKLSIEILKNFNEISLNFNKDQILTTVTEAIVILSNFNKCLMSNYIKDYIHSSNRKFEVYSTFIRLFKDPQHSVESSAAFCRFMTYLSSSSEVLIIAIVCNLLELSNYCQIIDYLPCAIHEIVVLNNISGAHNLFWNFKEIFFKCWGSFEFPIESFPFKLFDFDSSDDFFLRTYKDVAALSLAYNQKLIIPNLAQITNMRESSIVTDSMALTITISWTPGGIKNKIFKSFEKYFSTSKSLKTIIKDQYLLIVFHLFRFSDCSSESSIAKLFDNYETDKQFLFCENSEILSFLDGYELFIKPKSSIDMINYFADTAKIDEPWCVPIVYHLASKILLLIESSILNIEKKMNLRRLKLLYLLGSSGFINTNVCEIVTRSLAPYLDNEYLMDDSAGILNCILLRNSKELSNISIEVLFLITCKLFNGPRSQNIRQLRKTIFQFKTRFSLGKYVTMFHYGMDTIDESCTDSIPDIIEFVNNACKDTKNTHILIKYLSILFEKNIYMSLLDYDKISLNLGPDNNSEDFIQNLYNIKTKYTDDLSVEMIIWIGKCLGLYYERTGKLPHIEIYEYANSIMKYSQRNDFGAIVSKLDLIFQLMIDEMPSSSLKTRYCFETIVGVILHKKKIAQENIISYVSYDELFESFEKYIYPMGNYVCSLSIDQVENDNLDYYHHGLEQALNGFSTNIRAYKFEKWITRILFSIINELSAQQPIIILLANYICHIESFSVKCFCPLVLYFIANQPHTRGGLINVMIKEFFLEDIELPKASIELFVELVLLIRIGAKSNNEKFSRIYEKLNFPPIYEAALKIHKNKAALMIFEDYYTTLTNLPINDVLNIPKYSVVLKHIYENLDDKDLMFGMPIIPELDYGMKILRNNGLKWGEMMFDNAKFESYLVSGDYSKTDSVRDITMGMMDMGWSGVSNILCEYSNELQKVESDTHEDMFYEQLWKLNQWDLSSSTDFTSENKCIYSMLKQVKETPSSAKMVCKDSIERLIRLDINSFRKGETFNDTVESWMRTLSICHVIDQTTSFDEFSFKKYIGESYSNHIKWHNYATVNEFENLLLCRRATFELMSGYSETSYMIDTESCWRGIVCTLNQYNSLMTDMNLTQKSINSAVQLTDIATQKFKNEYNFVTRIAKFNLAKAFWAQQSDTRFPVETLKDIIKNDSSTSSYYQDEAQYFPDSSPLYVIALLAKWCDECKQETSSAIMTSYIEPLAEKISGYNNNDYIDLAETYHIMAAFCDDQIKKFDEDTIMEKLTQSKATLEKDIKSLTKYAQEETAKDKKRYALQDLNRLRNRFKAQTKELSLLKTERSVYIQKAINFYFKSILYAPYDEIDSNIDRFCSLWIENNDTLVDQNELLSVPTFNFVSWNKQLTSRLLDENTIFQELLSKLIIEIALSHPFHTLYLLKSLLITKDESEDAAAKSRGSAAQKIWDVLASSGGKFNVEGLHNIVDSVNTFSDKAVIIANSRLRNSKKVSIQKFPDGKWWIDLLPRMNLPSPVRSIPLSKTKPYMKENLPIIQKIEEEISIAASGVSHPKIMKMILSTGEIQRMLLKAPDDLRQDSIMKQVFEKVNNILWRDIETRKRKLRIRTYNVLPLGPTSGVLEFVTNSMPLVDILKGLHMRDSMDINEARLKIKDVQSQSKTVRCQTYKEICKNIQPCLRMFFLNNFTSSDAWFESRQIYSHGIATTSITGYILGLGDRHCNNILLDKSSGEPIHIDFGVAFDQGKLLPIPETVPFRLTRDIVDGLGITGVNGMFSKSSEHVLRVLRIHTHYICGILNILKYDPLYSWTLSPLRKKKLQQIYFNDENDKGFDEFIKTDTGSEANAAIETVKRKLEANGLSNEAVIRELIHEATDPKNLALIFMGWSAFL